MNMFTTEQLEALFCKSTDAVILLEKREQFHLVYANTCAKTLLKLVEVGDVVDESIVFSLSTSVFAICRDVLRKQEARRVEVTLLRNLQPVQLSIVPVFEQIGQYVLWTLQPIREQEMVEHLRKTVHGLETLKRALNSAAEISLTDRNGKIIEVNELFEKRTGYSQSELIGQTHSLLNSRIHPPAYFEDLWNTISKGEVWRGEICNRNKWGVMYWNETTIIPIKNMDGAIEQYLSVNYNVSDKKKMMTELRNIERTFRVITENTNDLIIITDELGVINYASPSYVRLLGYSEDELLGKFYAQILSNESREEWERLLKGLQPTTNSFIELQLKKKNGGTVWTEGNYKIVLDKQYENVGRITMVSREISERKQLEDRLLFMAYHDSLTHVPNRRFLLKEFPHMVERAQLKYQTIAVCYVDGDNFKAVNDEFGHDVGDQFIRQFSVSLKNCLGVHDMIVRLGGDEFIVLLTELSRKEEQCHEQIRQFYRSIQQELANGWMIEGMHFTPTASMGVACYPAHGQELDELLEKADLALYTSKEQARNSYRVYDVSCER